MNEILYVSPNASRLDSKDKVVEGLHILVSAFGNPDRTMSPEDATYLIIASNEIDQYNKYRTQVVRGETRTKFYVIFDDFDDFINKFHQLQLPIEYKWYWKWTEELGYEVTSKGDRRYSPFYQIINIDGIGMINLEDYYHKYIKPAKLNGTYKEGTGHEIMKNYLFNRLGLLYELAVIGCSHPFTDMFDKFGGQNKWYAEILNELKNGK